jgi:DNA-binding protein HU-beta
MASKEELIAKAAADAGISKAKAGIVLGSVLDGITASLKKGQKVAFIGFGTFSVATRAARTGRNPQTGREIRIPRTTVPKFKAGKRLKDAVC